MPCFVGRVDVGLAERHVGAVVAVEQQREVAVAAHTEDRKGGEALRIDRHALGLDPLALELLEDEGAALLLADPGSNTEIGRAAWRGEVCTSGMMLVVILIFQK